MDIKKIIKNIKIKKIYGKIPEALAGITSNSKQVKKNFCFVAQVGYSVDGHDYIKSAVDSGASLIVASKDTNYNFNNSCVLVVKEKEVNKIASKLAAYLNDSYKKISTVAVTGTNGKTSITSLIHNILILLGESSSYLGTNGFCKNDDKPIYLGNTTPDVVSLHNKIGEVKRENIKHFSFEASSHAMVLGRIYNVDVDIAIFTNLTHEHLDFHGDMQTYAYDKALLFSTLGNNLLESKYGVLNKDDKYYEIMSKCLYQEEITYSIEDKSADFYAYNIKTATINNKLATSFTLKSPEGNFEATIPFIGNFMVSNILAALIAVWLKGFSLEKIIKLLPNLSALYGRMEILGEGLPIDIISDFAHTPDGYEKLLEATKEMRKGRRTLLLTGMGGGRDLSKGAYIGKIISQADCVIITTDSPRDEDVEVLMSSIEEGMQHKNYEKIWFRTEAVKRIVELSQEGDVIILASKGREDYEILKNGKKVWHSDPVICLEEANKKYKNER
ncbi:MULTISPECIES: UDP-N-acetylmuramoyl-L-alanyl-D-glutamate--2,6-diaminopimelate ligase [unclassified Gemella]|uniref:UDP-N-acetylmuramoyl-L-alanyl-D-glutamate--2, 6-diaminopimelate ligase n=1 Tax=unclassified Gemella TaxID=2624949 RepID=UPI001C050E85|nr:MULTISPECIES: UDP-N-acetylmuramoyl-L-alanyl-D-glutamate--2,6-diaminopimelate ligase [unclassified Gemella]MBU0279085.1 UDP-N-acetylmuramoyl-L-alanyl-D-glutamate--2,6-diaminopimelate ligase [Gemella sp. zg-1178]QWQ39109.1 UDP-N-acetylmuramoyl-L-alanyl-D-glutamate--2,6-diaminopimelate ligase [Gemella sp. zg-570]